MTVSQLLCNISSAELTEWVAFYKIKSYEQKQAAQQRKKNANVRKKSRR